MMMVIAGIGPIVSPFLGTLLLTQFTWRSVFWLTTLFALFCVYCAVWLIPETLPRERRLRGHVGDLFRSYGNVLSNRRFLAPAISVGCVSGILFTYLSNAPFVFIQLNGIPLTRFSLYFAPVAVGVYISSQANRFLLKRFATGQLLRRAMVANVCGGLLLTVCAYTGVGGFPALYACLFLCLSTIGVIFPNGTAMTMQPFASQAGTASAMLGVVQFAVGAAAGALSGLLHNGTAMPMALQILGFGILARGVIALTPRRPVGA